ncbi:chromosome transmission fidelity protein 18 homolog [Anthonomus grandis grandis]|uniref:chromosome transmission fidelity protein 18 homolog n=1 Tax=Anthonomus grandis grandis TaxID=2921223 RepID=UPI00216660DC|nr:chromosome transmission fidelity protein 18 homolog [Anthonomus grandis grandis]
MSDFPDPDEEFELMYGDDLDLLREQEPEDDVIRVLPDPKARKSLDFATPSKSQGTKHTNLDSSFDSFQQLPDEEPPIPKTTSSLSQNSINPKKRSADYLFGDINDILDDDYLADPVAKKKKKGENKLQEDLELIDLIVQKRNEYKKSHLAAIYWQGDSADKNVERDKRNISYTVPKYNFLRLKSSINGKSVYVRFHSEDFERQESLRILEEHSFQGVMGDNFRKIWNDAQELLLKQQTNQRQLESQSLLNLEAANSKEKQLWVDLYKPKRYLELLSDESTNRIMLKWLKLWDKIVFNRNPKKKVSPDASSAEKKPFFKRFNELNTELDEFNRPFHKVALLCGPPGLGKTTLAHMVAKHAGYNVVEINASDDRSLEAFRTSLENATQMRSVVDQEKRPNCIVFDEIDGAPSASIDYLVKFITATLPAKKGKKQQDKSQNILKRPIICICNDAYVPALRPLKQIAFVVNFPQISSTRLAERLMEIARRQQIKTDMGAMIALAEKSNNDIRSCLSVLQFFKAQDKRIGLTDIYKVSVGQKDMHKGLFAVWSDIFELKRIKKPTGGTTAPSAKDRMQKILDTMTSFGDHERIAQGVYENFPKLEIKDRSLEGTCSALEWFGYNDALTTQIYTTQNYSLTNYLNYGFVVWHFVFASYQRPKLVYPTEGQEARTKLIRQRGIIAEVLRGMSPTVRCYNAALPLIMDVLPLLLKIIAPPFRNVSFHLYTPEEQDNLLRVASIMADYNLNYIQERKATGTYDFKLEPSVEDVVIFSKFFDNPISHISYLNRQLIAREIELLKIRKLDKTRHKELEQKDAQPNHLQTLQAKPIKIVPKTTSPVLKRDIFGRVMKQSEQPAAQDPLANDVRFVYKEGFSNAVKKRLKVKDLI